MLNNNYVNAINLNLSGQSPISAKATKAPKLSTRFNWFLNGTLLLFQAFYVLTHYASNSILGAYSILAIIFGLVCTISSIYPKISWNLNLSKRI